MLSLRNYSHILTSSLHSSQPPISSYNNNNNNNSNNKLQLLHLQSPLLLPPPAPTWPLNSVDYKRNCTRPAPSWAKVPPPSANTLRFRDNCNAARPSVTSCLIIFRFFTLISLKLFSFVQSRFSIAFTIYIIQWTLYFMHITYQ